MAIREIRPGIYSVGALDFDRRLFDSLIPLPDGTTYNAYMIKGEEKTALIDTVDPTKEFDLICNLVRVEADKIDYIIANHAEQDHSGAIPVLLEMYPDAKVVCTEKCRELLISLLQIDLDRCITVKDRETLPLGGHTLEFIHAPWVHWPETMLTYSREDRLLFTCDLFGSHFASSDLFALDEKRVYYAAKRYYAEIMMPFRMSIRSHMERLKEYPLDLIASSHGPIYRDPKFILDAYKDWISDQAKNEVIVPYVSMHGSTAKMVDYFTGALTDRGISVVPCNLTVTDIGELAMALVDAATVVFATPTVMFGPHPVVVFAASLANMIRPKTKFASVICSYGWGGTAPDQLKAILTHIRPEFLEPVVTKGAPDVEAQRSLDQLADDILSRHKAAGIIP